MNDKTDSILNLGRIMRNQKRNMKLHDHLMAIIFLYFLHGFLLTGCQANEPPYFTEDMNNHVIPENIDLETPVFTLKAIDPEGEPLRYGIMGTDKLEVEETSGVVTVVKPIDREETDRLKVSVTVQEAGSNGNSEFVSVPVTVIISDSNDNAPTFLNQTLYESLEVIEDAEVNSVVIPIAVKDPDLTGMTLRLGCTASRQTPEACDVFTIETKEASAGIFKGNLRLAKGLDYNKRSLYQFVITASDGEHSSVQGVLIRVKDVQNTPPIFIGAMSGRVMEDSQVGTLVMVIQARDGDLGKPRDVKLSITSNPGDVFELDADTGHLTTTRPLDRETLGSLITIQVKAQELLRSDETLINLAEDIEKTQTIQNMSILIDDVNDFPPTFNHKEFYTVINENSPVGTPLSHLDMAVTDEDTGTFADFTLTIDGPLAELFDIQPKFASASVRPVIRIKKSFDFENPNERKFILLIVAQNTDEPELYSTATVTVETIDINDNRPEFERDSYKIEVAENSAPGTKIGQIFAMDPDSLDFGTAGLVYQIVGSGHKSFDVDATSGEIFIADCSGSGSDYELETRESVPSNCLDYEKQSVYDLLYMASDTYKTEGFLHSIVPLQIKVTDSNDNAPYFPTTFSRTIIENTKQFDPRFFITAKDKDDTANLAYKILEDSKNSANMYFGIDEHTGELLISAEQLLPGNYSLTVEVSDGVYSVITPVIVNVTDINNHHPVFNEETLANRIIELQEDAPVGSVVLDVNATDVDLDNNGRIHFSIDKGAYGFFNIDEFTGEIKLVKDLDDEVIPRFQLLVAAFDEGLPPMRTSTVIQISVKNVFLTLPKIIPTVQRAQVSESSSVGNEVTIIQTNAGTLGLSEADSQSIQWEFVEPIEARDPDTKLVTNTTEFKTWFQVVQNGKVVVAEPLYRDVVTMMNLTVRITSRKARPGSEELGTLILTIFEVNDLPPLMDDIEVETYEELPEGMTILRVEAEDPEGGLISNYFVEQGSSYFSVDNKTGEIKVAGRLDFEDKPMYNLTVVAVDSGVPQLSSTATIMVSLININDNDPKFEKTEYFTAINEHPLEDTLLITVRATDEDSEDVITYDIEPGYLSEAFMINRLGEIYVTRKGTKLIDFEELSQPVLTLKVKAKDSERSGFATVRITIKDINDIGPRFTQKVYNITVHAPLQAKQEILKVTAHGGDSDETDKMHYRILSGNEEEFFEIDPASGIIRASQAFEKAGDFKLMVEIVDVEDTDTVNQVDDHYDRAQVSISVLPGNFRKPEFLFPNRINSTLVALESNAEEIRLFESSSSFTKVLGQLLAFDSDEGSAGEIKFYFKDGDNLVTETDYFRIETDTGKIHQILPLDRESMNKYDLIVVAKDSGVPVSSQTEDVLTIQIDDIDDHQPLFSIPSYSFTIMENALENTLIGQVTATDDDAGKNAEVFYFIVSDEKHRYVNEDIRVDIKTGKIYSNTMLDRERVEQYQFYVRASSSPLYKKSDEIMQDLGFRKNHSMVSVNITVLDENDNGPHFPERKYFAGINSDSEPGREILTFESVDADSSSPVEYTLIGSNLILEDFKSGGSVVPSPFRVDKDTGRLIIASSTMRQYSGGNNRFLVTVGVRETIPPYHSDNTEIQVWIVESSQETVLTIQSPPTRLMSLKPVLVEILQNITNYRVLLDKITPHVLEDGSVNKNWSDVYVTAVNKRSSEVVPVNLFLQALDLNHEELKDQNTPIDLVRAVPADVTPDQREFYLNGDESFDTAFAGLVALIVLLCMGVLAILVVCCCLTKLRSDNENSSSIMGHGMKHPLHLSGSIPGTPNFERHHQSEMIEDMMTDNPLWSDNKVKTYEEQELTMQVTSDMDNSNGSVDENIDEEMNRRNNKSGFSTFQRQQHNQRQPSPQFSNAYATLHSQPVEYDNLNMLGEDTVAVHL